MVLGMADVTQFSPITVTRHALDRWYRASRNGARLKQQLGEELQQRLEQMFGYHMVVLGVEGGLPIEDMTRVQQVICSSPVVERASSIQHHVIADDEELPFETDSVDVVVALHALDLSAQPHQVLREIHRVLTPHGHLLLVGLNPRSMLGGWRRIHGIFHRSRWRDLAFLSAGKIEDWLTLLDFNTESPRHKLPLPSLGEGRMARWIQRLDQRLVSWNTPLGSVYLIQANKMVRGHLHAAPLRRRSAQLIPISVARPVAGKLRPVRRRKHDLSDPEPR
jgi:SAM-dependent methyltransferase